MREGMEVAKVARMTHEPELTPEVRAAMPHADEDTVRIVAAVAGLLGAVAYADGIYDREEARQLREELGRVQGLSEEGIAGVLRVMEAKLLGLATVDVTRCARALRELADRDLRREVLEILLRTAAADGTIGTREVAVLRQITGALGLAQADYNALQERHRHLLGVLRAVTT